MSHTEAGTSTALTVHNPMLITWQVPTLYLYKLYKNPNLLTSFLFFSTNPTVTLFSKMTQGWFTWRSVPGSCTLGSGRPVHQRRWRTHNASRHSTYTLDMPWTADIKLHSTQTRRQSKIIVIVSDYTKYSQFCGSLNSNLGSPSTRAEKVQPQMLSSAAPIWTAPTPYHTWHPLANQFLLFICSVKVFLVKVFTLWEIIMFYSTMWGINQRTCKGLWWTPVTSKQYIPGLVKKMAASLLFKILNVKPITRTRLVVLENYSL